MICLAETLLKYSIIRPWQQHNIHKTAQRMGREWGSAGINSGNQQRETLVFWMVHEEYGSFMEYCLYIRATMILDSSEQLGFLWRKVSAIQQQQLPNIS